MQDSSGRQFGSARRLFSIIERRISVFDAMGHSIFYIAGPVWEWTFHVMRDGIPVGVITKKLPDNGMRSFIVKSDIYRIVFPKAASPTEKILLLGALFLLDCSFFQGLRADW